MDNDDAGGHERFCMAHLSVRAVPIAGLANDGFFNSSCAVQTGEVIKMEPQIPMEVFVSGGSLL